ncbi:MAG: PAS domain S-box protein, partial [Magnetococcales bacterium]|nr:PAS domain S-box protein [Magnetococcales bacterium]
IHFALLAVLMMVVAGLVVLALKRLQRHDAEQIFEKSNLWRVGIAVVSLFLALVVGVAWTAFERMDTQLRQELGDTLVAINKSVNHSLEMWLESRTREIHHLAGDRTLLPHIKAQLALPRKAAPLRSSSALVQLRHLYQQHMEEMGAKGFFIIAPDRISVGSMRDANIGTVNLIARQQPELMDRAFGGEIVFIPPIHSDVPLRNAEGLLVDKAATMFLAAPLRDAENRVIAVMTLRFDPHTDFSRISRHGLIGETGETYAFDRHAKILSASRFRDGLQAIVSHYKGETELLKLQIRDPGGNLMQGFRPTQDATEWPLTKMAAEALAGRGGVDTQGYRDYRGVPVVGAWFWSSRLGVGLATEIDLDEALASYHGMRRLVLGSLLGIALLALFLTAVSVWIGGRTRTQLRLLVDARTKELEKLTRAVIHSPATVVITDIHGNIEYVNPKFCEVTGYSSEEVVGQNPRVLKSPDTPPEIYKELWQTITQGEVWRGELKNKKKNGDNYWEMASISSVKDDSGRITHFVAVKEDITNRKHAAQALEAEQRRNQLILNSAGEGIFGLDTEGQVSFCNRAAARMLGYETQELLGVFMHPMVHHSYESGEAYPVELCPMRASFTEGKVNQISNEVLWRKDGSHFPVEYTATPIREDDGLIGAVVVFRDISEQKRASLALLESQERLELALSGGDLGFWDVDLNTGFTVVNQRVKQAVVPPDEVLSDGDITNH